MTGSADAALAVLRPGAEARPVDPLREAGGRPQLRNHGIWRAKPLLVSGATGYRKGEFLYQDYLYDDTGAKGVFGAADPKAQATFARFKLSFRSATAQPSDRPSGPREVRMSKRIAAHLRRNVYGLLALFFALSGTAIALDGQNTVFSDDITNGEVKSPDIRNETVTSSDVLNATLLSADVHNATLGGVDVKDESLTGADIDESSLGLVPQATLGGIGRWAGNGSCDPEDTNFVSCGFTGIELPQTSRVLLVGNVTARQDQSQTSDGGSGDCVIATSPGPLAASRVQIVVNDAQGERENASLTGVTDPLPPGVVFFGIECNQLDSPGGTNGINFEQVTDGGGPDGDQSLSRRRSAVVAEPEPVERPQPQPALAAVAVGRREPVAGELDRRPAQRLGRERERLRPHRPQPRWPRSRGPSSRSSATPAPKRLAPTPSPVWPTV